MLFLVYSLCLLFAHLLVAAFWLLLAVCCVLYGVSSVLFVACFLFVGLLCYVCVFVV